MKSKIAIVSLITLIISGCGEGRISKGDGKIRSGCDKISILGPDTYMTGTGPFGCSSSSAMLKFANFYCSTMGKKILVKTFDRRQVIFQCLDQGDKDLHRPTYQESPDLIIQYN
jgi:hypothetical protein